jgi:hypothetical protein
MFRQIGNIIIHLKQSQAGAQKFYCGLLACLFFLSHAYSANNLLVKPDRNFIFSKSNIYIAMHPAFSPKPSITYFTNPYNFSVRLKGIMNFNFGFVYMYNFNRHIGISAGLYSMFMSFKTMKFDYSIPDAILVKSGLVPGGECFKCRIFINHSYFFPLRFIYRVPLGSKTDFVTSAGLNLQLLPGYAYEFEDTRNKAGNDTASRTTFRIILKNDRGRKFSLIPYFAASIGINQLLKNRHYINYQFTANVPFLNPYNTGDFYLLPGTPYESHGTYKLNALSFALEVNYVFTFRRKKEWNDKSIIHYFNRPK